MRIININLLKQKDFFLLISGNLVSLTGNQLQSIALSLYVLKLTGSATKFASVMAITLIPKLLLGPIAGVFVDWFDRKKIIVFFDMFNGILVGIFAIIYSINGALTLQQIYILIILLSLTSLFFDPAVTTIIPSIVEKNSIVEANAISSFIMSIAAFLSPTLAGLLFGLYGLFTILVLNSLSFILASIAEMFINIPKLVQKPKAMNVQTFKGDFIYGIKFIKSKNSLLNIINLTIVLNFLVNPLFSVGIAYLSKNILKTTDFQYGLIQSIIISSMIISPIICSKTSSKFSLNKILFVDITITSLLIGILSLIISSPYLNLFSSNRFPLISFVVTLFFIGLAVNVGNISISCIFQKIVPISIMGRVGTVRSTAAMACMPLGQLLFGFLYDNISPWICIAISSIGLLVIILKLRKSSNNILKTDAVNIH